MIIIISNCDSLEGRHDQIYDGAIGSISRNGNNYIYSGLNHFILFVIADSEYFAKIIV